MALEPDDPPTLGRYRVLERLAADGGARVLLGVDDAGRRAALTIVDEEQAAEPGYRDRFRHEVRTAATAPPWFVAPVLDADPDADPPWLATAYVEGPSLREYVETRGPLGEPGADALAVRLADGLVALHGAGLAHRNLTPSTVLLAEDGPRLIGFGIARTARAVDPATPVDLTKRPQGWAAGPAGDMFAYAGLIVFAVTGRSPDAHPELDPGPLSAPLREVVLGCLAEDPSLRPTAVQVRDRLRGAVEPAAVPPPLMMVAEAPATVIGPPAMPPVQPGPARPRPRRRWGLIAAVALSAVAGAAVAVIVGLMLTGRSAGEDLPVADAPPVPATSAPGDPPPTTAPSSAVPSDPAAGATVIDAQTDPRFGTGTARFATPSGNIACAMTADDTRCDVAQRTWQLPPTPAECDLAYGTGAVLAGAGSGELSCVGDTVADPSLATLAYGQAVRLGDVVCVSRETGLRCENPQTRHGFTVARATYELF